MKRCQRWGMGLWVKNPISHLECGVGPVGPVEETKVRNRTQEPQLSCIWSKGGCVGVKDVRVGPSRSQANDGSESDKTQSHADASPLRDFVTSLKKWEKKLDYNPACSSRTDPYSFMGGVGRGEAGREE